MKQIKHKKSNFKKKKGGFVCQMHPARAKKIKIHRLKTIKEANQRLFAEIREEKYKNQSKKRSDTSKSV